MNADKDRDVVVIKDEELKTGIDAHHHGTGHRCGPRRGKFKGRDQRENLAGKLADHDYLLFYERKGFFLQTS